MRSDEEKKDLDRVIQAGFTNDITDYIEEARRFALKYLPNKVIKRYLAPNRIYLKEDYADVLQTMIHNYNLMRRLKFEVEHDIKMGREPDPYSLKQIKTGEELGF